MNSYQKNEPHLVQQRTSEFKWLKEPFPIGVTLTAIYLGVITYEVLVVGASGEWIDGKKLNSLGDFLAGLFAPVAFLWLVVTVFLQKQELSLTRQEMVDTRNVMIDQAAEAKAQKEFIEQQTAIMKRQADLAETSYKKNLRLQMFDKRVAVYDEIHRHLSAPIKTIATYDAFFEFRHLVYRTRYLFNDDVNINEWLHKLSDLIDDVLNCGVTIDSIRSEWDDLTLPSEFDRLFGPYMTLSD